MSGGSAPTSLDDGAGGGGAGGFLDLRVESGTFIGTISARGGGGGNALTPTATLLGPGGGGGGGVVVIRCPGCAPAIFVDGGVSGVNLTGSPHGATSGSAGLIVYR